jgi:Ser/Thr protein kinase RdoA (MazF antagonist)
MQQLTVSKSFIQQRELARIVAEQYGLSGVSCQLISATMRDVYLVVSNDGRNILMLYQHGLHTAEEVAAEWQFLDFLAANGLSVAPAIKTRGGDYMIVLPAPEGIRYGVLSTYAAGEHLRRRSSKAAVHTYGRMIAQIHTLADHMPFLLKRADNSIKTIITQSIAAFEAEVQDRPEELVYLRKCGEILCAKVEDLPREKPIYGLIHGDVIRANALVSDEGTVTVIDFDLCGPGWRAYDVASYLHTIRNTPEERVYERAFLSGYNEARPLSEFELEMIPVFEAVRAIFSIGIPAMNIHHWGRAYFYAFLDSSLNRLKSSMAQVV